MVVVVRRTSPSRSIDVVVSSADDGELVSLLRASGADLLRVLPVVVAVVRRWVVRGAEVTVDPAETTSVVVDGTVVVVLSSVVVPSDVFFVPRLAVVVVASGNDVDDDGTESPGTSISWAGAGVAKTPPRPRTITTLPVSATTHLARRAVS